MGIFIKKLYTLHQVYVSKNQEHDCLRLIDDAQERNTNTIVYDNVSIFMVCLKITITQFPHLLDGRFLIFQPFSLWRIAVIIEMLIVQGLRLLDNNWVYTIGYNKTKQVLCFHSHSQKHNKLGRKTELCLSLTFLNN